MATIEDVPGRASSLTGTDQPDSIYGYDGNDIINPLWKPLGWVASDFIDGGDGIDTFNFNAELPGGGWDTLGIAASITGVSLSSYFGVYAVNMEYLNVSGGHGNDTFYTAGALGGHIGGGPGGSDQLIADLSKVTTNCSFDGTGGTLGTFIVAGIDMLNLTTGSGNDSIISGGGRGDYIATGSGNDRIDAGKHIAQWAEYDVIDGQGGTDTWVVDASHETLGVAFNAFATTISLWSVRSFSDNYKIDAYNMERVDFTGGRGDDFFNLTDATSGEAHGQKGVDWLVVDFSDVKARIDFDLFHNADLPRFKVTGMDRIDIKSGSGHDTLVGGAHADHIQGRGGNDIIDVKTHDRQVNGESDFADGGAGIDTLVVSGAAALRDTGITANLSGISSTSGKFSSFVANMEVAEFQGGSGNDHFTGGNRADELDGNEGNDFLDGRGGDDKRMFGWDGKDVLVGGTGKETLRGGAHADTFDFNSLMDSVVGGNHDVIQDFRRADGDKIDLRGIDADIDGTGGNQLFTFIGGQRFHGVDGELRFAAHLLQGDVNGDGRADFEVYVNANTLVGGPGGDLLL